MGTKILKFGRMDNWAESSGEQNVFDESGTLVATISKYLYDAGTTSREWRVDYYAVEFWEGTKVYEVEEFHASNFVSARAAHNAAKLCVRRAFEEGDA